jgi:hypothetical protein
MEVRDVARGVPGHVDNVEVLPQHPDRIAAPHAGAWLGDRLPGGAIHRALQPGTQARDTADMIVVMVRH